MSALVSGDIFGLALVLVRVKIDNVPCLLVYKPASRSYVIGARVLDNDWATAVLRECDVRFRPLRVGVDFVLVPTRTHPFRSDDDGHAVQVFLLRFNAQPKHGVPADCCLIDEAAIRGGYLPAAGLVGADDLRIALGSTDKLSWDGDLGPDTMGVWHW